jgi:phenylalanyl-tRNA synthetase alpha chain
MSLSAQSIEDAKGLALQAIAGANSLDTLKEVKLAHVGDKSPIARANR